MKHDAHLIEIDHVVVSAADLRHPVRMTSLVEAEVLRALNGAELHSPPGAGIERQIAREVTRSVARSVQGGSHGI